jgi:hypothetical protein
MDSNEPRTLVVAGALLPAALAPQILAAARVPRLAERLRGARRRATHRAAARSGGAAHWSWLAQALGLPADPPASAPYAWQALGGAAAPGAEPRWIAHCEPVHIVVARDHLRATDLGSDALSAEESAALLALANEAARASAAAAPPGDAPPLQFAERGGHWFVQAAVPLQLETWPLDAVLGRSIQACLPAGAHARAWRRLENEIQMMWHASAVTEPREERGARPANALWLHGGGSWRALGPATAAALALPPAGRDAAILAGWRAAGAARMQRLAFHGALFAAYAQRAWDDWLDQLPALEARVEDEAQQAQREGTAFELVLCGAHEARTYALPGGAPSWRLLGAWLRELPRGAGAPQAALRGCLVESEPPPQASAPATARAA